MRPFLLALALGVVAVAANDRPAQAQYYTYSSGYPYPGYSTYYAPNYYPSTAYQNTAALQRYSSPSPYWSAYTSYRASPTYGSSYFPKPAGYAGYYPGYPTFSTTPLLSRFGYPVGF